ncbi:MAG: fibronectin type III domain-containing protein [Patescibacteria group bacterium]|jgi:hypothetical protein
MEYTRAIIKRFVFLVVGIIAVAASFLAATAFATDYVSSSFILRDPVVAVEGGLSTSASFQYLSTSGQTVIGASSSSSFAEHAGFLYFPSFITAPLVTPTAGIEQVALSWTVATGSVAVDHYLVGTATTSGAETYENVGNVTSFTKTGLTGGTTYYFTVRAIDSSGSSVITSSEVTSTPTSAIPIPPPTPVTGGGGFITPSVGDSALPSAPRSLNGEALDATSIRWFFEDTANNETGFEIRDASGTVRATTPPWVSSNLHYLDEQNLHANERASGRTVDATNVAGASYPSDRFADVYTLIESPIAIEAALNKDASDVYLHAVSDSISHGFSNLSAGRSALLFENVTDGVTSGWVKSETYLFANLVPGESYQFRVRARNGDGIETRTSPLVTVNVPPFPSQPGPPPALLPAPIIMQPIDGSTLHEHVVIVKGQSDAFARIRLVVAGVTTSTVADDQGLFSFKLADLPNGQYVLLVSATRQDGRRSAVATVHFAIVGLPSPSGVPPSVTPVVPPNLPPSVIAPAPVSTEIPIASPLTLPRVEQIIKDATRSVSTISGAAGSLGNFVLRETPRLVTNFGTDVRSILSELAPPGRPTIRTVIVEGIRHLLSLGRSAIGVSTEIARLMISEIPRLADQLKTDIHNRFAALPPSPSPKPFFLALWQSISSSTRLAYGVVVETGRSVIDVVPRLAREYRNTVVSGIAANRPQPLPSLRPFLVAVGRGVQDDFAITGYVIRQSGSVVAKEVPAAYGHWQERVRQLAVALQPPASLSPKPFFLALWQSISSNARLAYGVVVETGRSVIDVVPRLATEYRNTVVSGIAANRPQPLPSLRPFLVAVGRGVQDDFAITGYVIRQSGKVVAEEVPAAYGHWQERVRQLAVALQPPSPTPLFAILRSDIQSDFQAVRIVGESTIAFALHDIPAGIQDMQRQLVEQLVALRPPSPAPFFSALTEVAKRDSTVLSRFAERTVAFVGRDTPAYLSELGSKVAGIIRPLSPTALTPTPTTPSPLVTTVRPRPTTAPTTLPADTVIAKSTFGNFPLSVSSENDLHLPINYSFKLFVRPSRPVTAVTADLILTQVKGRSAPDAVPENLFLEIPQAHAMTIPEAQALALSVATFPYQLTDEAGVYATFVTVPPLVGHYELRTHLAYSDGPSKTIATDIVTEDAGYIYAVTPRGQQERIRDAVVTLSVERSDAAGFTIWPGSLYDQVNPTYTDETGSYQFLPPPGRYRLSVEHPDYETYQSDIIDMTFTTPIARPIELKPRGGIFTRMLQTLFQK